MRYFRSLVLAAAIALPATAQDYVPGYDRDADRDATTEIVLVYFGSSSCAPCQLPEFKTAMEQAKTMLLEQAESGGKGFAAIGVALDWNVEEGLAYLASSGRFDEVIVGRNWFNSAALAHIWRAEGLEERIPGMPGIMVFEREIGFTETGVSASAPVYLVEQVGADAIPAWVADGAPLD